MAMSRNAGTLGTIKNRLLILMDGYSILFHQSYGNFIGNLTHSLGPIVGEYRQQKPPSSPRSSNKLRELPETLGQLQKLKDLRADANLLPAENLGVL